jgi:hypothetical protein
MMHKHGNDVMKKMYSMLLPGIALYDTMPEIVL